MASVTNTAADAATTWNSHMIEEMSKRKKDAVLITPRTQRYLVEEKRRMKREIWAKTWSTLNNMMETLIGEKATIKQAKCTQTGSGNTTMKRTWIISYFLCANFLSLMFMHAFSVLKWINDASYLMLSVQHSMKSYRNFMLIMSSTQLYSDSCHFTSLLLACGIYDISRSSN